jgi:peptide/nickel transport system ATP-binding protein
MNNTVLRTENLKAFYILDMQGTQKVVKAVNEVNLDVRENEVYGIAGESGCGKTTLLKALFGDMDPPLRLIGGKVYYYINGSGMDITSLNAEERRQLRMKYISYVPQGSMSVLNPVLKLKESYHDFMAAMYAVRRGKMFSNWLTSTSRNWVYPGMCWMLIPTSFPAACASG